MLQKNLPSKTVLLWQLRIVILCAFLTTAVTYICNRFPWYPLALAVLLILFAVLFFWYLPALFRSYRITMKNGAVIIDRGVIIKTTHIMPFSKMIYTETFSTPLAKAMGLTAISLKAARSFIFVPELPVDVVKLLLEKLAEDS